MNLTAASTLTIHAPLSKVWSALIDPAIIKQYLYGSEIVTEWMKGSAVIYKGNYQGRVFEDKGVIVTIEPETHLVMTHWSPLSGTADIPENYHTVSYQLMPIDGGTRVSITQDNNDSEAEREKNADFWLQILKNMKKILE